MSKLILVTAVLLALDSPGQDTPKERHVLVAKVDHAVDGDSVVVVTGKKKMSVRIEGIDAPELKQEFGEEAKKALAEVLPKGADVVMEVHGKDKYDRMLAVVYHRKVAPESMSLYLLQQGFAWHFSKYNDNKELAAAQKLARSKRRGLWAKSVKPMAPWDHRVEHDRGEVMDTKKVHKASPAVYERPTRTSFTRWMNLDDNQRHRVGCRRANHDRGRPCTATEGTVCKVCGG